MATCSLADLQAKACDNGFTCLDDVTARAIELQLWYKVAGSTLTSSQLLKLACDNGFACANTSDDKILAATELQFLCNIKNNNITPPAPECTNLIPDGSVYQANGRFYLRKDINGINPDILQLGQTYVLTFGVNENSANNESDGVIILPANTPYTFTYPGSGGDLGFYLHTGIVTGLPVTATLCVAQLNQFNIDAFAGVGGSISPGGTTTVNAGDDLILTATPDPGYAVSQWLLDGNPVDGTSSSYTIAGVNADHTIEVQFEQLPPIVVPRSPFTATFIGTPTDANMVVRLVVPLDTSAPTVVFGVTYGGYYGSPRTVVVNPTTDSGYGTNSVFLSISAGFSIVVTGVGIPLNILAGTYIFNITTS